MSFDEIIDKLPVGDQKIIREITALYEQLDGQTENFAAQTGLKCKTGCGACCENPDIETTIAEVLPLAAHLWSQDLAESKLESIRTNSHQRICVFFQPNPLHKGSGRCGIYAYRPGLCRLFGFAARQDKYGKPTLLTCKIIKETQPEGCAKAQEILDQENHAPLLGQHAFAVSSIDPVHGQKLLPINEAITRAIEKIGYYLEKFKQ